MESRPYEPEGAPVSAAERRDSEPEAEITLSWLEGVLPRLMRRLMDSENLDMPLLQLPLAQIRLAQALYDETRSVSYADAGETMGRLSERLGVRHNALTQTADRLIAHELAERLNDPHDRRIVRLRLTGQGRTWVQERRSRRHTHLLKFWETLTSAEQAAFVAAVRTLEALATLADTRLGGSAENPSDRSGRSALTVEETLSRFTLGAINDAIGRITPDRIEDGGENSSVTSGPLSILIESENRPTVPRSVLKEGE